MWNDFRLALRQLAAAKGFTATAVLTLALGIGANTGIFTLLHAVLVKSLPVSDPATLVRVGDGDNCCVLGGPQGRMSVFSYPLYRHIREHTPEIAEMMAFQAGTVKAAVRRAGANTSDPYADQFVSGNFFRLLGIQPYAGRLLTPDDDLRGAPPAAVMSYRVWRERYGADPSVIGTPFLIEGAPFTIVGIAPPGFYGAVLRPDPPDFWMPLAAEPATRNKNSLLDTANLHWLYVFGRMAPGAPPDRVEAKLTVTLRQWLYANETYDRTKFDQQTIALAPGGSGVEHLREFYRRDLRLLLGITGLVLLIACANLANLQLARGAAGASQTSIRVALGAPRSRLIRLSLMESTILAVAGGALGLVVASQTARLLIRLSLSAAAHVPIDTTPSMAALGFSFALSLVTGVAFGAGPAWSASRADPAVALHGVGRGGSGRSTWAQKSLVVFQAALSLVLLAGAGLMARTLRNLGAAQFGFRADGLAVASVNPGFASYTPEKLAAAYAEIDRRIRQIPGVRDVSLALYSPMSGDNWQTYAALEDRPLERINPSWDRVGTNFFDTLGARIVRGRGFGPRDTPGSMRVAVVNETFAAKYFPNQDVIGKRFGLGGPEHRSDFTIVGVVEDIRFRSPRRELRPMAFMPLLQMTAADWQDRTQARANVIQAVLLRVDAKASGLAPQVQRALGAVDPNLTMLRFSTASQMAGERFSHEQMIGTLAQVFGFLALALASIGLYGLTAYSVARRTAEMGVRSALGATRGQIVRLILRSALMQAGVGVVLGVPAALAAGRLLADQVYGVATSDPLVLAGSAAVLAVCAAAAAWLPAVRAASVDPARALQP